MRSVGLAHACCAIGILSALFLFSLLTGAIVERFVGLQWTAGLQSPDVRQETNVPLADIERELRSLQERQAWIGTLTMLLLWAAAGVCLLAFALSYRYLLQARRQMKEGLERSLA